MSLRTNLATRPFYNERAVGVLLVVGALVVAALTVFNVEELVSLSAKDRGLVAAAAAAEARTRELRLDVWRTRTGIDATHVADVSAAAHEANVTIDQRMFSWTELFNRLEAALPTNVRLSSVKPTVDEKGRLVVTVVVVSRSVSGIDVFLDALEKTGTFHDVLSRQERETTEELVEATIEGTYNPATAVRASQ